MDRRLIYKRHWSLVVLGGWLAACSFDAQLPGRNSSAAPVNSGVMLSGAGAADDVDAAATSGDATRITDIASKNGDNGSHQAVAAGAAAGSGSGGASDESAGDIAGAASSENGAAGAGGSNASGGAAGSGEPPVLWFSEYIEGSSSNKALEITAQARAELEGCKVATYFNGKTEATTVATLSGVLEAGQVFTLCTSALKEKLTSACNQVGNLTFNGDDVVSLSCDGTILDVIGQIGVDPGTAWGSDQDSTVDHTLRRKCTVQSGDPLGTDPFDPGVEWQSFPVDTFDGLGARGC